MVRFDFPGFAHSVITYTGKGYGITQLSLFESMFAHYSDEVITATRAADGYDSGHVSAYVSGRRNIPKPMVAFYFKPANRSKLEDDISSFLSLLGSGQNGLVAVIRRNLLSEYPLDPVREDIANRQYPDGIGGNAAFLADAVLYAMSRPSLPRDRSGNLIGSAIVLKDHFLLLPPPKPPIAFAGRAADLVDLNDKLDADLKVNLFGPPGIGKSALAAAHVSSSAYKNILWITYTGDLRRDIAQLERIDKATLNTLGDRYDANMRIISLMASDSLIVIDQYDAATLDQTLPHLLDLKCKILILSRHPLHDYDCTHKALTKIEDTNACLELFRSVFCATYAHQSAILEIIRIVDCNPTLMVLCAKLLQDGAVTPDSLRRALSDSAALPDNTDIIPLTKDGLLVADTYLNHICTLLRLADFGQSELQILRAISVLYLDHTTTDIQVGRWLRLDNQNAVNALVRAGLVAKDPDTRAVSTSSLVRNAAVTKLRPDIHDCIWLLNTVATTAAYHVVYRTMHNMLSLPYLTDDPEACFDLLEAAFSISLHYGDEETASQYLASMDRIQASSQITRDDIPIKYLSCAISLGTNFSQMNEYLAKAIQLAADTPRDMTGTLASMHINLANHCIANECLDDALSHLDTAADLLESGGLQYTMDYLNCCLSTAYLYAANGHHDDCHQLLDSLATIEIHADYGDDTPAYTEAANFKYSVGSLLCYLGDYRRAREVFKTAAALFDIVYVGAPDIAHAIQRDMHAMLQGQPLRITRNPDPSLPAKITLSFP